jgi:hypothetical protein
MARIRSIKPEVRKSRTVTSWPREVRLAWIYLWGFLDDEGRGEDDLSLVKAECFPRDRDVTERKLNDWLWMIATKSPADDVAPLCRYTVDGVDYLHATKWRDHQRINRPGISRVPHCPEHEDGMSGHVRGRDGARRTHASFSEDAVNPHGAITDGSSPSRAPAEQGAGSKEQGAGKGARNSPTIQRRETLEPDPATLDGGFAPEPDPLDGWR